MSERSGFTLRQERQRFCLIYVVIIESQCNMYSKYSTTIGQISRDIWFLKSYKTKLVFQNFLLVRIATKLHILHKIEKLCKQNGSI